jgi:protein kinase-like protein/Calx-beta domain-containing protein
MTRQRRNPIDDSQEPIDLFRSIKSKIAQRGGAVEDDDVTVDLIPAIGETAQDTHAPPQAPASAANLSIGAVVRGRYVIESQLASGGMGTVYKVLDRARAELDETNAHVAIKVLHERSAGAEVLSKLRREFFCAQALSHQSIAKVFELELDGEFPFFTMELIDGETLLTLMQKLHPLPLPRAYACAVIREVGAGVAHAHDRRVIHGDLKPQNVMVTNTGELRILDFGRSGELAAALTPAYASCELLEGRAADPRDDLFALACLSYELLAGEHPFQNRRSTEARTLKMTPHRPPGLSGRQWKALKKGLAWDRANRPQSVREWLAEFGPGSDPLGPVPVAQDFQALPIAKGHRMSVLIVLLATILVCGITWAVLSRPKAPSVAIEAADPDADAASTALNVERALAEADTEESEPPAAPAPSKADIKNRNAAPSAARPMDRTEKISLASASYPIGAGQKFAEIRVHRSAGSKGDTSFEWWTEPGSALAGDDFAPQAPTTTFFPSGVHTVSLFIKVVPNAARKRPAVFYVVLGNPSTGTLLGAVSKAAVSLHP